MSRFSPIIFSALVGLTACGTSAPKSQSTADLIADVVKVEMYTLLPALSVSDQAAATRYAADIEAARQAIDLATASGQPASAQIFVLALQGLVPIVAAHLSANSPASIALASAVALAPILLAESGVVSAKPVASAEATKNVLVLKGALR